MPRSRRTHYVVNEGAEPATALMVNVLGPVAAAGQSLDRRET